MRASHQRYGRTMAGLGLLILPIAVAAFITSKPHPAKSVAATPASLVQAKQQLAQQQAQVKQLQDNVATEESNSKRDTQHLQQQDQAILKMQQELKDLQAKPGASHR